MTKQKVIIILGPTAVGKSDLAVLLAKKYNGEVISADSRQVYKGMDIGTGKITKKEMMSIPHYLLDIENPKKTFNVTDFTLLGKKAIEYISYKKKLPIICGGTGFYIDSLINGLEYSEVKADHILRKKLEQKTAKQLMVQLTKLDPVRAKNIDPMNKRRIIRAIEIAKSAGNVPAIKSIPNNYSPLFIGLNIDRTILRERIMQRLLKRINAGMIDEVKNLHKKGLSWKRLNELGLEYRYVSLYLQKKITKEFMIEKLHTEICRYAKRQMAWFKRNKKIFWFAPEEVKKIEQLVKKFI
jgi:tRNA dimethylallyltransferase